MCPLYSYVLPKTTGAESLADDVLCAQTGPGNGEKEPRLAPGVQLKFRLADGSVFAADIEVRLQFVAQGLYESVACVASRAVERGLTCVSIRGGREKRVFGNLHRVCIQTVEAEDELVHFPPRLAGIMLKPARKATEGGFHCGRKRLEVGERQRVKFLLVERLSVEAAPTARHQTEIGKKR